MSAKRFVPVPRDGGACCETSAAAATRRCPLHDCCPDHCQIQRAVAHVEADMAAKRAAFKVMLRFFNMMQPDPPLTTNRRGST